MVNLRDKSCDYRRYRFALACAGCVFVSFLLTCWSHHQLQHDFQTLQEGYGKLLNPVVSQSRTVQVRTVAGIEKPLDALSTRNETVSTDVIHIVYTRFMQHQANLTDLGLARLQLLDTFFLKSLEMQTTKNFLVVIRTDPNLDNIVKVPLLELLDKSHHGISYLLIATNENVPNSHQLKDILKWVHPAQRKEDDNDLSSGIWGGSMDFARSYLRQSNKIVIETRLDADDGLHRDYLQSLQSQAQLSIISEASDHHNVSSWRIWCAGKYLEWQMRAPWETKAKGKKNPSIRSSEIKHDDLNEENSSEVGSLVSLQVGHCISAGLSVAYSVQSDDAEIPTLQNHESIAHRIRKCHGKKSESSNRNCLEQISLNPSALRARTPTSAGMLNVLWDWSVSDESKQHSDGKKVSSINLNGNYKQYEEGANKQRQVQDKLWLVVESIFGVSPKRARALRLYLESNIAAIAKDNLSGQCSAGHSCKNSSQAMLLTIVNGQQNSTLL